MAMEYIRAHNERAIAANAGVDRTQQELNEILEEVLAERGWLREDEDGDWEVVYPNKDDDGRAAADGGE